MKILKKLLKKIIKNFCFLFVKIISKFKFGRLFLESLNKETDILIKEILHKDLKLKFFVPNELNLYRVQSFSVKEPDTIDWIDSFKKNSIFWDVGSNIGLFSCYAASRNNCTVYSFEPSVFNLEILCKNINLNKLNHKITVFPLPLTDSIKEAKFKLSSLDKGGAISSFGEDFTFDGSKLNSIFEYKTIGVSINEIIKNFKFLKPDYLKIDVDGIEHLILSGGGDILNDIQEILVEVDEKFERQFTQINKILNNSGFKLKKKSLTQNYEKKKLETNIFNQIWEKK